jgi:S1-C subfamily serine protease
VKNRLFVALLVALLVLSLGVAQAATLGEVFKRVNGAVVMVVAESKARGASGGGRPGVVGGVGSGVLISQSGKVLTAAHVVDSADQVRVQFAGGVVATARVVSSDPVADVALLQVADVPARVVAARVGDSDKVDVGDQVFVVGAPYGISETLSVGYISARRASRATPGDAASVELFQTDAAIAPGNSGGPMFNLQGEVIGIVSHMVSRSGGSEGIGFAVTTKTVKENLLEAPAIWTGLAVVPLSGELARLLNLPQAAGLLVMHTAEDSPGARLGLRAGNTPAVIGGVSLVLGGDIILSVAGTPIEATADNYRRVRDRLQQAQDGETLAINVLRGGQVVELKGVNVRITQSN